MKREPLAGTPFEVRAPRILFGDGVRARLAGAVADELGRDGGAILLVRGQRRRHADVEALLATRFEVEVVAVAGEPTIDEADAAAATARRIGARAVVALGGGSALDLGKAAAILATHETRALDHLEVIGKGLPLTERGLPFFAVPTTAGTGSEVTKNAVLADPSSRIKASLRSDAMLARLALVDPELTHEVPPDVTAATGLDALTQVIEPFLSHAATPFTDALTREAIPRAPSALRRAFVDGRDAEARRALALVSVHGGLALAHAKLGAVHGMAAPIGGGFTSPHGAICARLLPIALRTNHRALVARAPGSAALLRFDELAQLLTGRREALAEDGIVFLEALVRDLAIPPLSHYGVREEDVAALAIASERASSMKGNPIVLERSEIEAMLRSAL